MVTVHSAITPRGMSDFGVLADSSVSAVKVVFSLLTTFHCTQLRIGRIKADRVSCKIRRSTAARDRYLNSRISTLVSHLRRTLTRRESIVLVFCCTFLGVDAKIL